MTSRRAEQSFPAAVARLHAAMAQVANGDIGAITALYSHCSEATSFYGWGGYEKGWGAVAQRWERLSGALQVRRKLAFNGAASVSLVVDGQGRLQAPPQVRLSGVVNFEPDEVAAELGEAVAEAVEKLRPGGQRTDGALEQAAIRAVRAGLRGETGRKPITQVHVVRLD